MREIDLNQVAQSAGLSMPPTWCHAQDQAGQQCWRPGCQQQEE